MKIIVTTNKINLKNHIKLKNIEKIKSVGELDLFKANSLSLKDEVILFKSNNSEIYLMTGLKWIKKKFKISSIIFLDYVYPVNDNLLGNHIIIPKKIYSINDPPLEWSNNPLINKIQINSSINKKLRKVIYETNYDFLYGNILSIDEKFINDTTIHELRDLSYFDALNNLVFSINKFAIKNEIDIYNICIGKTNKMRNLKFENLLEKLF
tara:strand:- start:91 stop:717 length:627 start_codon:yes stop_codon:yes gene_type:complete